MDFFYGLVSGVVLFGSIIFLERHFFPKKTFMRRVKSEYRRVLYSENVWRVLTNGQARLESAYCKFEDFKSNLGSISIDNLPEATQRLKELRAEITNAHESHDYLRGLAYLCGHGQSVDKFYKK